MAERIFTDEELRIGSLRSVDAMAEALERGDRQSALFFCKRLRREVLSMQQNYDGWEASLRESIRRLGGEEAETNAVHAIEDESVAPERCGQDSQPVDRWREEARAILTRVEAGHDQEALERARNLHEEALQSHDRGMSRVSALLSWITRHHGADALEAALEVSMSAEMLGDASYRERAEALMHFTRVHLQPFALREDDEKLTFLCPVCPSGGRLLRAGHYEPPRSDAHAPGPRPLTWGRESLPAYCCHEPVMEKASIEKTGVPLFVVDPPERLGVDPCPTYLYKDPADIPERFYTRLGLEKPKTPDR
ncbi:MAG: hypothetical protein HKO98_12170 [Gemmatimonadetes bacterium]|nr:hypothetical protein [Gemmatimonadota bacterium]